MADMNLTASSSGRSLKVDLTPMVDLGFILISFFLFTRTLSDPKAFKITMPDKPTGQVQSPSVATLTLYADAKSVRYAEGKPGEHPEQEVFLRRMPSLRAEIQDLQVRLDHSGRFTRKDLTVLIHPGADLSYMDLIGVLDEMRICDVAKYMIIK
jgi:biopolymer transport protein ExbD